MSGQMTGQLFIHQCVRFDSDGIDEVLKLNMYLEKAMDKYSKRNYVVNLNVPRIEISNDMSVSEMRRRQTENERNVNRLRNCMPEKLNTFCKMHLSFLLELDGSKLEEMFLDTSHNDSINKKKTATPFSAKKKEKPSPVVYETLSKENVGHIYKLISFLQKSDNLKTEGVFRKTGNVSRQRLLKDWIKEGAEFTLNDATFSPHDVATVLKQLLAELPDPLLTEKNCEAYMQIIDMVKHNQMEKDRHRSAQKQLKALQLMILLLPRENAMLLECLLDLLHRAANTQENKMSAGSLGVVFAPSLLCPRKLSPEEMQSYSPKLCKVITVMIENAPSLFTVPKELGDDVAHFWREMENPNMAAFEENKENLDDKANIQKAKYGSSSAVNTVLTFTTSRKSPEEVDSTQDTQVALAQLYAHVQSMPESAKKKKLLKQFNRASAIHPSSNSTKKGKHTRSRTFGESLKKHFPILAKHKHHEISDESSQMTCLARPAWFDDSMASISYAKTPDSTYRPLNKTNSPAVHVVDLGASPCNVKPRKRLSDENLKTHEDITAPKHAHLDKNCKFITKTSTPCKTLFPSTPIVQKPVAMVSPITKSVKKLPEASKKELLTPGSRLPLMMIKSPSGSYLETVL